MIYDYSEREKIAEELPGYDWYCSDSAIEIAEWAVDKAHHGNKRKALELKAKADKIEKNKRSKISGPFGLWDMIGLTTEWFYRLDRLSYVLSMPSNFNDKPYIKEG